MKTYLPDKNKIDRESYLIDASDFVLGRLATKAAVILRGKKKVNYTPHLDVGDYLTVINADKIKLTGNKLENKKYYKPTGYIGNLKSQTLKDMLANKPEQVIIKAIEGMIPKNKLKGPIMKRLTVYNSDQEIAKNKKDKLVKIE